MREIVLDTETTGLSHATGHRLVEIGCIELIEGSFTGRTLQKYINPERDMPPEAFQVHGLSTDFLKKFPPFQEVVEEVLAFLQDDTLVIHNARFDMGFLQAELSRAEKPPLKNKVIDTLVMAKQRFPGQPASLDALCKRLGISLSERTFHGALLDAQLLSQVYSALRHQTTLQWGDVSGEVKKGRTRPLRSPRQFSLSAAEEMARAAFLQEFFK